MMFEQHYTLLGEVLAQVELVDSVRLLTWFFSTTDNLGAASTCSVSKVLATAVQLRVEVFADNTNVGLESSHASLSLVSPVLTSSLVLQAHTPPPPALPMSDIKASGTPAGFSSLMLIISTKPKKHDHSSDSASDDQCDKRAHIGIMKQPIDDGSYESNVNARSAPLVAKCDTASIEGGREQETLTDIRDAEHDKPDPAHTYSNVNSGCSLSTFPVHIWQWSSAQTRSSTTASAAGQSPNQPQLTNPPSLAKGYANSDDVMVVEDSGSMGDLDGDSHHECE